VSCTRFGWTGRTSASRACPTVGPPANSFVGGSAYFSGSFFFCFAKKMQIAKSTLILGSIREFRASKNFPEILPGPFTYIYSKNGPDEYGI
jgi:hypothetical protein